MTGDDMTDDVQLDREAAEAALRVVEQFPLLRNAHVARCLRAALGQRPEKEEAP